MKCIASGIDFSPHKLQLPLRKLITNHNRQKCVRLLFLFTAIYIKDSIKSLVCTLYNIPRINSKIFIVISLHWLCFVAQFQYFPSYFGGNSHSRHRNKCMFECYTQTNFNIMYSCTSKLLIYYFIIYLSTYIIPLW